MGISKYLLLAILSMDAYNRGFDTGIADGKTGNGEDLRGTGIKLRPAYLTPCPRTP